MTLIICSMPQCQTTAGCVCGMNSAKIGEEIPMLNAEFVCEVPRFLGRVTKLRVMNGKVVADTESGIEMVIPRKNEKA